MNSFKKKMKRKMTKEPSRDVKANKVSTDDNGFMFNDAMSDDIPEDYN